MRERGILFPGTKSSINHEVSKKTYSFDNIPASHYFGNDFQEKMVSHEEALRLDAIAREILKYY